LSARRKCHPPERSARKTKREILERLKPAKSEEEGTCIIKSKGKRPKLGSNCNNEEVRPCELGEERDLNSGKVKVRLGSKRVIFLSWGVIEGLKVKRLRG